MGDCIELTIFSGHRQAGTSIGRAHYRIDNGPIFAGKIAVKSCTLYNTIPNIPLPRATLTFRQYGGPILGGSLGFLDASILPGSYTGPDLAAAIQASMLIQLAPTPSATVAVVYNTLTRKLEFTFDAIYSYYIASEYIEYFIESPGFNVIWLYQTTALVSHIINSNFVAGTYRLDQWLDYCSGVLTADAQVFEPTANITMTNNYYPTFLNVTFQSHLAGSTFQIPGYNTMAGSIYLGMDYVGMNALAATHVSSEPFPFSYTAIVGNAMEPVLNFSVDGIVNAHNWISGPINLSGDLYIHFRSRTLANKNHRTVENSRDTTFFSMPVTSSYTQLQYYEPNERVWIAFRGGIELTDFEIDLYNEHDERVEISQNYVLELLIKQTEVF